MKLHGRMDLLHVFSLVMVMAVALAAVSCGNPPTPPSPPGSQQQLSPPNITSPLYQGAEIIEAYGVPGAEIRIFANGKDVGGSICGSYHCWISVQPLVLGVDPSNPTKITATQKVDSITSSPTRTGEEVLVEKIPGEYLTSDQESLLPPTIGDPLAACQKAVLLEKTVPGARVKVFSLPDATNPIGQDQWPWKAAVVGTGKELTEGESIAANQELVLPPAGLTQPARSVQPKPVQMKVPVWNPTALVPNQDAVVVGNLWIGATVEIYHEAQGTRTSLGGGVAIWPNQEFGIKPLQQSWLGCADCIKVDQFLCEADKVVGTSEGKGIGNALDRPTIDGVICSGSYKVTTCNTTPKSILTVWRAKIGGSYEQVGEMGGTGDCITITLGDDLVFEKGDQVQIRQEAWNLTSESTVVTVDDPSTPLAAEIAQGQNCPLCSGQPTAPVFLFGDLTDTFGPIFKAAKCGVDGVEVSIKAVHGDTGNPSTGYKFKLEPIRGEKGHFEGMWDWPSWPSTEKEEKQLLGLDTATFSVQGSSEQQDRLFYITDQGCRDLEGLCVHDQYASFYQDCVDLINRLRDKEGIGLQHLTRENSEAERCADRDTWTNTEAFDPLDPHKAKCSGWQNAWIQAPYFATPGDILTGIEQEMYEAEKQLYLKDPSCSFSDCGHYFNITDPSFQGVACGLYKTSSGRFASVQNFYP